MQRTSQASRTTPSQQPGLVFALRREPLYHKLQYSKVPKFDAAAAAFGVIVGAFAGYLGLSSLGSAGADLTDLTTFCWYVAVWLANVRLAASLRRAQSPRTLGGNTVVGQFFTELGAGVLAAFWRK